MAIVNTSQSALPLILGLLAGCSGGTGVISGELVAVGGARERATVTSRHGGDLGRGSRVHVPHLAFR
jgi:hypothetical protein